MRDYYLKFDTKEEFDSVMESINKRTVDLYTNVYYGDQNFIVDEIGPVLIQEPVNDEDFNENFNEIEPAVFDESYHVNLRLIGEEEFPAELIDYKIQVNSPSRQFSGGMFPVE
jgi:hypothetical protein